MASWISYLRQGLSRTRTKDRLVTLHEETSISADLENLRFFFVRHWRKGLLGAGIVIFLSLILFPQPLITRYLIDDVIIARQLNGLWSTLLVLGGIKGVSLVLGLVQNFYFTRFEQTVILDIQSELFDRLLRFPKSFFDMTENGYLMARIQQDVQGVQWFFSQTLVSAFSNFLRFLGGVVFLFYLEWRLAMAVLVFLPLLVYFLNYFSEKIRVLSNEQLERNANVSQTLQESLASTTLIKTFTSEKHTVDQMVNVWRSAQQLVLEQTVVSSLANFLIGSLPSIANAVVFVVGAYWVIQDKWTFGSLTAFQGYLGYVFGPAMALAATNMQMQNAFSSLARISALFNIVPEENLGLGKRAERLLGEVEFKGVTFSYDGRESIFENVSFHAQAGEHIAIIGPSGVGKTTLISLIMRLYQPTKGDILFDGCLASDYELSSLRRRIGYIPQVSHLLSGTILENLRYGYSEADDVSVMEAAKVAGIHEFILDLPDKYQTQVGESGVNLSEGQKQRIAIARALIRNPDILILDEPTSALDNSSENSFVESLKNVTIGRTIFLISHHLSTIKYVDRILVLDKNHVVGFGDHSELFANNAYYRSLVESQRTNGKN